MQYYLKCGFTNYIYHVIILFLDPFVKINFLVDGTRISKKRTHMKKRTLNPVYNESFVFDLPSTVVDLHNVCIEFCVFDHDRVTKNEVSYFKKKSNLFQ